MKKRFKLFGIIALAAVMGRHGRRCLSALAGVFASRKLLCIITAGTLLLCNACSNGTTGGPGGSTTPTLQNVTYVSYDSDGNTYELVITEAVKTAKVIRAAYNPKTGDTFVLTIKNILGNIIGKSTGSVTAEPTGSSITLTLTSKGGEITVTVSSSDDKITKIEAVNGIPNEEGEPIPAPDKLTETPVAPEDLPDEKRWFIAKYVSTATVDHFSVDNDVCKVTIGGVPEPHNSTDGWRAWTITTHYAFTAKKNTYYTYEFEAWTDPGEERILFFQWYEDNDLGIHRGRDILITSTRTTYKATGEITKGGVRLLEFELANQLGTVYVKMLPIKEYTPALEYELINEQNNPNNGTYRLVSGIGMSGAVDIPSTYNSKPVTEIGDRAFERTNITSVTIPSSVTYIGIDTFSECNNLTTVTFVEGSQLQIIADWAFSNSPNIKSITIPSSVTFVYLGAFQDWTSSQTINVQFASQAAADNAWGSDWRLGCNATIVYKP